MLKHALKAFVLVLIAGAIVPADETPQVLDSNFKLMLVAEHPQIVTPVGAVYDDAGRLLVIESQTHHRKPNYEGPEKDRIRIVSETDGDGKADKFETFLEGTSATMSLARGADGWIYIATRQEIFRVADQDNDGRADDRQPIAGLVTNGNYPHNGLCGLAFDSQGRLVFGIGENLGADYKLVAADGTHASGSGEGGVFRCGPTGTKLERIATGFWNPFGICVDRFDRIFAVGNDPDGSPPCRLLHVVETGDYGFQFRYGRSGKHPLQAWNGELPGTLPMIAGTGEAPCEMVIYHGRLWVASWGHHRIERYELIPQGASFQARREIVVQGDENFRPVGFAKAPDGSLVFTDWVDKSYPVHGKGRIWRLTPQGDAKHEPWPELSEVELLAGEAARSPDWESLKSEDRFLHQAAVAGLARAESVSQRKLSEFDDAPQRLGLLQAVRWRTEHIEQDNNVPVDMLREALDDENIDVRLYAVRWIADAKVAELRDAVAAQLTRADAITPRLYLATIATLEILDTGKSSFDPKNRDKYLLETIKDESKPVELRSLALQMVDPNHQDLTDTLLSNLADQPDLRREATRTMVFRSGTTRDEQLIALAFDEKQATSQDAADAAMGLGRNAQSHLERFRKSLATAKGALRTEIERTIARVDGTRNTDDRPSNEDLDKWMANVGTGGDPRAGWRVFFAGHAAHCGDCHRFDGRGADIGPDLTGIGRRMSRRRVLESILQPSREIAPHYVPSTIQTTDGRVLQGLWQGYDDKNDRERFVAPDGKPFEIDPDQIEARSASSVSLMPADLHKQLTIDEIRDLLALLSETAEK